MGAGEGPTLLGQPSSGSGEGVELAKPGNEQADGELGHQVPVGPLGARPCDTGAVNVGVELEQPVDAGRGELHPAEGGRCGERLSEPIARMWLPHQHLGFGCVDDGAAVLADGVDEP